MASSKDRFRIKNTLSAKTESKSLFYATTIDDKKYSVRLKPYIKCHFCKLLFETNNKRTTHERQWHSTLNKLQNMKLIRHDSNQHLNNKKEK
jgi:hypothetical protein